MNGEILFLIAPSNKEIGNITYNSLVRHPDLSLLKTYGFYIFDESNRKEWKIYDNKYINILNICEKFKKYYSMAVVLSGNTFINTDNIYPFVSLIQKYNYILESKKKIIAGTPYFEERKPFLEVFSKINQINEFGNLFKNEVNSIIDLDFCFINLELLADLTSPLKFITNINFYNSHPQMLLNSLFLKYSVLIDEKIYLKKNNLNCGHVKGDVQFFKDAYVFKLTENYFPFKNLDSKNYNLNTFNYFIFNKLFDEYKKLENNIIDEKFSLYLEETYFKTYFANILLRTMN